VKYLNNIVEQDHRRVKRLTGPVGLPISFREEGIGAANASLLIVQLCM
jgi:transposase-like protein